MWRDTHKRDFIDTILRGYPFPQIFLARGPINVETMEASTCVVDGQQRLNAIREYVAGDFPVAGKRFSDLTVKEKEEFLKYEVAVIDFDLDAGDANLKEIFKRLNRTFYSLSTIERIATEFSASQFLLVARTLCGDLLDQPEDFEADGDPNTEGDVDVEATSAPENTFGRDPGISPEVWERLSAYARGPYSQLISGDSVFSNYEAQRKVPLMFVLNVMSSIISGYYNRNAKVKEYLERYNDAFPMADAIIKNVDAVATYIVHMKLPENSMWWNKANFFTMTVEFEGNLEQLQSPEETAVLLMRFEKELPAEYALAAREAVNNKTQRLARAEFMRGLLNLPPPLPKLDYLQV